MPSHLDETAEMTGCYLVNTKDVGVSGWWSTPLIQFSGGRGRQHYTEKPCLELGMKNVCVCVCVVGQLHKAQAVHQFSPMNSVCGVRNSIP